MDSIENGNYIHINDLIIVMNSLVGEDARHVIRKEIIAILNSIEFHRSYRNANQGRCSKNYTYDF
jgi:hypothetical protein